MSDELHRDLLVYEGWVAADRAGRDDEADTACRELFARTLPPRSVPLAFAANTMATIAAARAIDAARARRARLALLCGTAIAGPVAIYFGAGAAMSVAASLLLGSLNLLVNMTKGIAGMSDWNVWSLMGSLGRALAAIMSDGNVTLIVIALHGIAFAALFALQRLLGPDTESFE
jgi:hypothetical protein